MKTSARSLALALAALFTFHTALYGALPALKVTVSNASGKLVYQGTTNAKGTFTTGKLEPGKYVVQFNGSGSDLKGHQFALVVGAGKTKVSAGSVPGEKFSSGGVAMRVDVSGPMNLTGQVSAGGANVANGEINTANGKVKIVNGKRYVWVAAELGSHLGGHWVEEGSPEARNVLHFNQDGARALQDRGAATGLPGH